ncbi:MULTISPECIES: MobA/MobL family protein [Psychrobacter]|uniref:MobA/MobL family protein n=1 Tax=Psychrobacter TaxID=497 RepID=UPI00146F916B|nr:MULTISPECIES: MobA/MobL family protein [Psychrobacter]
MAIGRLNVRVGKKGKAAPHAKYIFREGKYQKCGLGMEEVECIGSGNMPKWAAHDPNFFWQMSDIYERKNGTTYREHVIALPRELTPDQRQALVEAWIKQELGDNHAYQYAIHNPPASDGKDQPHCHLMFSERLIDGIARDPDQYFKRYNAKNPERGGAKKANVQKLFSERQEDLYGLRGRWEDLCNGHLKMAGSDSRITMKSYKNLGIDLKGCSFHIARMKHDLIKLEYTEYGKERKAWLSAEREVDSLEVSKMLNDEQEHLAAKAAEQQRLAEENEKKRLAEEAAAQRRIEEEGEKKRLVEQEAAENERQEQERLAQEAAKQKIKEQQAQRERQEEQEKLAAIAAENAKQAQLEAQKRDQERLLEENRRSKIEEAATIYVNHFNHSDPDFPRFTLRQTFILQGIEGLRYLPNYETVFKTLLNPRHEAIVQLLLDPQSHRLYQKDEPLPLKKMLIKLRSPHTQGCVSRLYGQYEVVIGQLEATKNLDVTQESLDLSVRFSKCLDELQGVMAENLNFARADDIEVYQDLQSQTTIMYHNVFSELEERGIRVELIETYKQSFAKNQEKVTAAIKVAQDKMNRPNAPKEPSSESVPRKIFTPFSFRRR